MTITKQFDVVFPNVTNIHTAVLSDLCLGLKNLAIGVFAGESKVDNLQEVLLDRLLPKKKNRKHM